MSKETRPIMIRDAHESGIYKGTTKSRLNDANDIYPKCPKQKIHQLNEFLELCRQTDIQIFQNINK